MSQLVTCCPHCSTSFHVNEQQLRAARGAVRCGSCLQVFRADENIVFTESNPGASKDLEALLDDDDFLIHDDIDLDGEPGNEDAPVPPTMPASDAVIEDEDDSDRPMIGEAFGDSQWREMSADVPAPPLQEDEEDSDATLAPDWDENPWADESPEPPRKRESALSARWDDDIPTARKDEAPEQLERIETISATRRNDSDISASASREHLISAIEPAPLEMSWQPRRDRRVPGWLWVMLALVLALLLAAQTAYFRFDSLSKQQPWRSIYARICPTLGCQLPPLADLQAIHTSNLVVRSHPKIAGALVVDAVLLNTAPYPQPFPSLLLNFSDLKNNPVASRRFAPREYLQGELAGRKQMPSGNPVHIAIEIADPGSEAVNYELHIAH
ncbi:DUF3426 domain-containing protein [Microbulbifer hainanensis]|uniref:DUF3426 domain-containing protein n=1 Tax=Microbulbifer hainanensis TaxID=2735675 RepID=UPI0018677D12|nr:DUF3426 domain-containing protein [Microbulbifer hainanensis]